MNPVPPVVGPASTAEGSAVANRVKSERNASNAYVGGRPRTPRPDAVRYHGNSP